MVHHSVHSGRQPTRPSVAGPEPALELELELGLELELVLVLGAESC